MEKTIMSTRKANVNKKVASKKIKTWLGHGIWKRVKNISANEIKSAIKDDIK